MIFKMARKLFSIRRSQKENAYHYYNKKFDFTNIRHFFLFKILNYVL